jgi:dienelactone hydrolase
VVATGDDVERERVLERLVKPLGDAGYFVVAVQLGGEPAEAIEDLHAALLCVKELARGKLGVIGVGAAAPLALAAAAELPHVDAVVHAGGELPPSTVKLSRVRAPVLVQASATSPTDAEIASLRERLRRGHAAVTLQRHDTPAGLGAGDPVDARIAWDQTRQFLDLVLT